MRSPTENPTPLPDAATVQRRKDEARAWFESLRDRICAAFEKIEDELTGTHSELRARPLRAQGVAARGRAQRGSRRRRHVTHARPRVREGGRQRLDRVRRVQPGVPQADPGRRRGSALLRHGHLAGGAPALAPGAGGAHEHAPHRDDARLVRRRRRPHADGAAPARHRRLSRRAQGCLRRARRRLLSALQEMVRRVLLSAASRRAARRRRHLLRRPRQRRLRPRLRLHAWRRRGLPRRLSAARARRT